MRAIETEKTNGVFKDCEVCGERFEDNTRPKNKKTCSRKCGDEARKARQRKEYRKENPPKLNQRQLYYYNHYEYAFWNTEERIADNQTWKHTVPYSTDKVEKIQAAQQRYDLIGGRKKNTGAIDYNGDEKGVTGVSVQFVEHDDKKASEVTTYQLPAEELAERRAILRAKLAEEQANK